MKIDTEDHPRQRARERMEVALQEIFMNPHNNRAGFESEYSTNKVAAENAESAWGLLMAEVGRRSRVEHPDQTKAIDRLKLSLSRRAAMRA